MNKNIFLKDLASMLSQAAEIDVFTAETFVKCFSEVFEDALRSEGLLKIKGLGTFNIEQSGNKHRVVFLPERELAEAVNAPFKFFEPVVLSDDVTNEELDKYNELEDEDNEPLFGTDIYGDTSDDPEPDVTEPDVPETDVPETDVTEHDVTEPDMTEPDVTEPDDATPIEPTDPIETTEPSPEPDDSTPIEPKDPIVSNVSNVSIESIESSPVPDVLDTDETDTDETDTDETDTDETDTDETDTDVLNYDIPNPAESNVPAQTTVEQRLSQFSHGNNPYDTEWSDNDDYNEGKPWFWIAIAFLAGILMGGATGFLCHDSITGKTNTVIDYTKDYEQPTDTVVTPVDVIETPDTLATTENTDTIQETEAPIVEPEPEPAAKALPQAEKVVTDTVTPKNFLTLMAKKHYGRADYWVYIYLENESKIPDPNNVLSGTVLVIPPRSKYDKSTDESENLRNAKEIAREIANEQQLKHRK